MISPRELTETLPLAATSANRVREHRAAVMRVLRGDDGRFLVVAGPCSLHDPAAALAYGERLAALAARVSSTLLLVMRAYPEKSRTALGWRGLAEEPFLDGRRDPEAGIQRARRLLVELADLGIPLGAEIVSPYLWRYWEDCLSWGAVGARGVEAQILRETAANLPFACAFKNTLSGDLGAAVNAALVASRPTLSVALGPGGKAEPIQARGNPLPHLALRGGRNTPPAVAGFAGRGPTARTLRQAIALMRNAGLAPSVLIDAAHDNARPFGQAHAARRAARLALRERRAQGGAEQSAGDRALIGLRGIMLESNLEPGSQAPGPLATLRYGVSVTDPCIGWAETEALVLELAELLA